MNFEIAQQNLADFSETGVSAKFDVFFNETKDLVFRVAYHYMRCNSEAEDILQSVFLKIFTYAQEKPKEIQAIKNLKSWLIQIVVNTSKMSIRTKIRQRERNMKKQTEENTFSIEQEDLYRQVTKYLSDLPEKYRLPVCLHYVENMSYAEISTVLNVDQPTVKVQASRGIAKLREIMQKAGIAITPTALSSVLVESSFQKAPANIFFNKNASLKSTRLEQVLDYNKKSIISSKFLIFTTLFISGLISVYVFMGINKEVDVPVEPEISKNGFYFNYSFAEKMPETVSLAENVKWRIEKDKGLVLPAEDIEYNVIFSEVSMYDQPFSVVFNSYANNNEPTPFWGVHSAIPKKTIWQRPTAKGGFSRTYKIVFSYPYEIIFIEDIPAMIKMVITEKGNSDDKIKLAFGGGAVLSKVIIQSIDEQSSDNFKKFIYSKINAKEASSLTLDIKEFVEVKQKGLYLIPSIQDLKRPLEILIKMKAEKPIFNNLNVYFLDDQTSLTKKWYGRIPNTFKPSKTFHVYLFDEIGFVSKDNEQPLFIFEASNPSLNLNKQVAFEFNTDLIESIHIVPQNSNYILNKVKLNIPFDLNELKIEPQN